MGGRSRYGARVVQSERATRRREQAKHFQRLASTELQPRARAQLLGLAEEYEQLADMNRDSRARVLSIRE